MRMYGDVVVVMQGYIRARMRFGTVASTYLSSISSRIEKDLNPEYPKHTQSHLKTR